MVVLILTPCLPAFVMLLLLLLVAGAAAQLPAPTVVAFNVSSTEMSLEISTSGGTGNWYGIGFGASMGATSDFLMINFSGSSPVLVDCYASTPGYTSPQRDIRNDWTLDSVIGSTVIARRLLSTGDTQDTVLATKEGDTVQLITAVGSLAGASFLYHGGSKALATVVASVLSSTDNTTTLTPSIEDNSTDTVTLTSVLPTSTYKTPVSTPEITLTPEVELLPPPPPDIIGNTSFPPPPPVDNTTNTTFPPPPPVPVVQNSPAPSPGVIQSNTIGLIVGAVCAGVFGCALAAVAVLLFRRYRTRMKQRMPSRQFPVSNTLHYDDFGDDMPIFDSPAQWSPARRDGGGSSSPLVPESVPQHRQRNVASLPRMDEEKLLGTWYSEPIS